MRLLEGLARLCAVAAGVLLTVVTLVTCASLAGRNTIGVTIVGDIEIAAAAAGAAIALFMPWCQLRRAHIIVDFFTTRAATGTQHLLDRLGAALSALALALVAWRTGIGGLNAWASQSGSMLLGLPEWIVYAAMAPPLALAAAIAALQALRGFESRAGA